MRAGMALPAAALGIAGRCHERIHLDHHHTAYINLRYCAPPVPSTPSSAALPLTLSCVILYFISHFPSNSFFPSHEWYLLDPLRLHIPRRHPQSWIHQVPCPPFPTRLVPLIDGEGLLVVHPLRARVRPSRRCPHDAARGRRTYISLGFGSLRAPLVRIDQTRS